MKKIFYIIICLMAATAVYAQKKTNPLSYPYYICGTTTIDPNDGTVTLRDISYKGFSCKEENFKVGMEQNEKVLFRFEEIKTTPQISLSGKRLQYWRQDESGRWLTDAEGGNGITEDKLSKHITIMLVLDCSESLGDDFNKVKNGALSFLRTLLTKSSSDFVRFGIIGFSSTTEAERQTLNIQPLNAISYTRAERFINGLSTGNATGIYYAINKAIDMLDTYVRQNFRDTDLNNYEGTYMLTFTDGRDNASRFSDKKIFVTTQAYQYVKDKLANTIVNKSHIDSYIIGAKGTDLTAADDISRFKTELGGLISNGYNDRFIYIDNMRNLENAFSNVADGLVKKWQNLFCYSSIAHEGGVCWTYGDVPVPVKNLFLGLNAGVGLGADASLGGLFSCGLDIAFPITDNFGLGGYGDVKVMPGTRNFIQFTCGIMTTIGNYSSGQKAFVGGIGIETLQGLMPDIRVGVLFRNGLYIMGGFSAGKARYYEYYVDEYLGYISELHKTSAFNASVKVGFNFGKFIKIRKKR